MRDGYEPAVFSRDQAIIHGKLKLHVFEFPDVEKIIITAAVAV